MPVILVGPMLEQLLDLAVDGDEAVRPVAQIGSRKRQTPAPGVRIFNPAPQIVVSQWKFPFNARQAQYNEIDTNTSKAAAGVRGTQMK